MAEIPNTSHSWSARASVWLVTVLVTASLVCDYLLVQLYFQGSLHTALLIVVAVLAFLVCRLPWK